jgi:hypothetical protein
MCARAVKNIGVRHICALAGFALPQARGRHQHARIFTKGPAADSR